MGKTRSLLPSLSLGWCRRPLVLVFIVFLVWDRIAPIGYLQLGDVKNCLRTSGLCIQLSDRISEPAKGSICQDDPTNFWRRGQVKDAMIHAWSSYEKYAWGQDELQPLTKNSVDTFGGLGATLVDSLDTLLIMGLDEQFLRAREWVANSLDFNKNYEASVLETTIRVLGGLLSAYDLSGDKVFLEKAQDIADRLLPAWNTPSGIPYNRINLAYGNANNPGWTGGNSVLADSGTEQLEYIALSQRTRDLKYQKKVENVIEELRRTFPLDGLLPIYINPHTGATPSPIYTCGAMGDREMWEISMEGLKSLIRRTTPSSFAYICEKNGKSLSDKMDELACFAPGILALASYNGPREAEKYLSLAEEDMSVDTSWNILRPETIESLYYLWRITGNKTYQEWGWNIFQAFERNSRIETGYVGHNSVKTGIKDKYDAKFLSCRDAEVSVPTVFTSFCPSPRQVGKPTLSEL